MTLSRKILLYLFPVVLLLSACDKNRLFEKNVELGGNGWASVNKIFFEVPVADVNPLYDVYVNVRIADQYPYSNLFLFVDSQYPDGKKYRDTLELTLANQRGQWLGKSIGDTWDNQILYRKNVKFPVAGTYKFSFEQAMRVKELPMVNDIGLRIEKQDN